MTNKIEVRETNDGRFAVIVNNIAVIIASTFRAAVNVMDCHTTTELLQMANGNK